MKIVANANSLLTPLAGIGQYTYQILSHLKKIDSENDYTYYYGFYSKELPRIPNAGEKKPISFDQRIIQTLKGIKNILADVPIVGPMGRELRTFAFRTTQAWKGNKFDLYFEPNFLPLDEIEARKTVTMMFDLSVLLYPEWHPKKRVKSFARNFKKAVQKSDIILTATEYVKSQMNDHLHIPNDKIIVIPACCNEIFKGSENLLLSENNLNIPEQFFLFVGSIEPRKNILSLIKAYQQLPDYLKKEVRIVFCGPKGWKNEDLFKYIQQNQLDDRFIFFNYIADEQLLLLYKKAIALVYPSYYEGFGLPPVEAMASGCPVIASDIPTHREVCGNNVLYIDPHSIEQLSDTMKKVIEESSLRESLKLKGLERSKNFSWSKAARATLEVFKTLI